MRKNKVAILMLLAAVSVSAQIVSPMDMEQPGSRRLQQIYVADLERVAAAARAVSFPYAFYFSRRLDIDESQQKRMAEGSICFDRYNGQVVLSITGNYYAAYPSATMDVQQRVRRTFSDVMLPLLRAAVPAMAEREFVGGFAIEVAHHVRGKLLGVDSEGPENIAMVLPREAAQKLLVATTDDARQAALLDGEMYVNRQPFALWLTGDVPPEPRALAQVVRAKGRPRRNSEDDDVAPQVAVVPAPAPEPTVSAKLLATPANPLHLITERELHILQTAHATSLARLRQEMAPQMHFVEYAPPAFITFRSSAFLQLSFETLLGPAASGSRYHLAALAFDDHIAHLVRPVLKYFSDEPGFDGVDFSTTVRGASGQPMSVEFLLPLNSMRCFADYTCTGQQLLNSGYVLINGERAGLQLDTAEREQ